MKQPAHTFGRRFVLAVIGGAWHPASPGIFPKAFNAAARAVLLCNARGFPVGRPSGGARAQAKKVTRGSGSVQSAVIRLPDDVVARILTLASDPVLCWMPQLWQFLSERERAWLDSCMR